MAVAAVQDHNKRPSALRAVYFRHKEGVPSAGVWILGRARVDYTCSAALILTLGSSLGSDPV